MCREVTKSLVKVDQGSRDLTSWSSTKWIWRRTCARISPSWIETPGACAVIFPSGSRISFPAKGWMSLLPGWSSACLNEPSVHDRADSGGATKECVSEGRRGSKQKTFWKKEACSEKERPRTVCDGIGRTGRRAQACLREARSPNHNLVLLCHDAVETAPPHLP